MLILHDYLVESDTEIKLKKENAAIRRYHAILSNELDHVNESLNSIEEKDKRLYEKFFSLPLTGTVAKKEAHTSILVADAGNFRMHASDLGNRTNDLINRISSKDQVVTTGSKVGSQSLPVLTPVEDLDPSLVLSGFGLRINPFHKALYQHEGVDIAVPRGTPVRATGAGKVLTVKKSNLVAGFGNYIEVDHGDNLVTRYTHLDEIIVKAGADVKRGDQIGLSGNSGGSVAPHLHYEILRNGKNIDPIPYMIFGVSPELSLLLTQVSSIKNQALD